MKVNFVPNLFLEVIELEKFKDSLDKEGFRKNILENSESFGFIKNKYKDPNFLNCKVSRDVDDSFGNKTVKVEEFFGIDSTGNFLYKEPLNSIVIPNDGSWYWLRTSYQESSIEKGLFSISQEGNLVGNFDSKLLSIFRGQPNFPTRIKFENSIYNTQEYDVVEVINNQNAIISHPGLSYLGASQFIPETGLKISLVGTFTPGILVPPSDKFPFKYDSSFLQVLKETSFNTPPPYIKDSTFYIARCRVVSGQVIIQDKRSQYWKTEGTDWTTELKETPNPLIGIEAIKWNHKYTPADKNIVEVSWGMRSLNWTIDTSSNTVTFYGGSEGGRIKAIEDFINGDFDGWRLYTENGEYSKVLSSVKQGSSINLLLDVLEVNNYSSNGGNSLDSGTKQLLVVPDCEEIEIKFEPINNVNTSFIEKTFKFSINTFLARCELVVFKDICEYKVSYRNKLLKEYTEFLLIPDDTTKGYLTEISFNNGVIKPFEDRSYKTYQNGIIQLILASYSYINFVDRVDRGDLYKVRTFLELSQPSYELQVGVSEMYNHFIGDTIQLASNTKFILSNQGVRDLNEFTFHFDCLTLNLNNFTLTIEEPTSDPLVNKVLKEIKPGDIFQMMNQDKGISIKFVWDSLKDTWIPTQNYNLGAPTEIKILDGQPGDLFNVQGWGKVRGLFGYHICNGEDDAPDMRKLFVVGYDSDDSDYDSVGNTNVPQTSEEEEKGYRLIDGGKRMVLRYGSLPPHIHITPTTTRLFESGSEPPRLIRTISDNSVSDGDRELYLGAFDDRGTVIGVNDVVTGPMIHEDLGVPEDNMEKYRMLRFINNRDTQEEGNSARQTYLNMDPAFSIDRRPPYYTVLYAKKMF